MKIYFIGANNKRKAKFHLFEDNKTLCGNRTSHNFNWTTVRKKDDYLIESSPVKKEEIITENYICMHCRNKTN